MAATNDRLSSGSSMIDLHHVSKTFRKQDETVDAVRDISLTIAQKEIVAIIGPSGCGKSTLLNMIAGLYAPSSGSIVYKGARVSDVNTDVGYMTQKDNLLPWRTVQDNIAFPLELAGAAKGERVLRSDQVIAHVGLDGFAHRYPHELSGGMRKRACLARMLIYGAETALLDDTGSRCRAISRACISAPRRPPMSRPSRRIWLMPRCRSSRRACSCSSRARERSTST
jgi:NitT/TauT family transport system ATP-binding protein